MVYDCFPFFNELDILKVRLNVLSDVVDRFIIEESTVTFSGQPKELCFEQNKEMFAEFLDRITYIVVDDSPVEALTHERDYFQKNKLIQGLKDAKEDDVIIFGDLDEIPDPKVIKDITEHFDTDKVYHLAQRNFYAFMNMEETSGSLMSITGDFPEIARSDRKWLGTKVCSIKNIPEEGIVRLRDLVKPENPRSVRVADGGWHFGYMGGHNETNPAKRIGVKVVAAAHQEYNDKEILKETMDHLILGEDIFGREAKFERVEIGNDYPEYLVSHLDEFQHFYMKKITPFMKVGSLLDITCGKFIRKAWRHVLRKLKK
jgi:beta-1,4-mannosyl-glycoprotein beta-1,4-N-acetylglucosaminyltransferase